MVAAIRNCQKFSFCLWTSGNNTDNGLSVFYDNANNTGEKV